MYCVVQAVPERLDHAIESTRGLNPQVHIDHEHTGSLNSFLDMLPLSGEGYRLHLQDDLTIADELPTYFKYLERVMRVREIDLLQLYACSHRKYIADLMAMGEGLYRVPVRHAMGLAVATVFSPRFVTLMRREAPHIKTRYPHIDADDVWIQKLATKYECNVFQHLPSLVQHNIDTMPSVMGNGNNWNRKTEMFDPHYISRMNEAISKQ